MVEHLHQIEHRLDSVNQLSSIISAIRGIAAARFRESEAMLDGIRDYAGMIGNTIGQALFLSDSGAHPELGELSMGKQVIIALCSEQGFAGGFNGRVLDRVAEILPQKTSRLFVVGSHGMTTAAERGLMVDWSVSMAGHAEECTGLAIRLSDALFEGVLIGVTNVVIVHTASQRGGEQQVVARQLLPFDFERFPLPGGNGLPRINLSPRELLVELAEEYIFAELCEAVMLSFAAENETRMKAMITAHENIGKRLEELKALARRKRQEEITAEVVELAAGVEANLTGH